MKKINLLILFAVVALLSGCVSQGRHESELRGLRGHVVNLTTQVTRLDNALSSAEQTIADKQAENMKLVSEVQDLQRELETNRAERKNALAQIEPASQGVYRTRGGLELSAFDIQKALTNAGYYSGSIDGKIGPDSREAIRRFQTDEGLTADGVCGKVTWDKLRAHMDAVK